MSEARRPPEPPVHNDRFSTRIDSNFDYTIRDDVVGQLLNITSCPIVFETTDCMCIFNDQCYDFHAFDTQKTSCWGHAARRDDSGYPGGREIMDPRTGLSMPFAESISNLYFRHISTDKLKEMLLRRIKDLTLEEAGTLVPNHGNQEIPVDEFVAHVK